MTLEQTFDRDLPRTHVDNDLILEFLRRNALQVALELPAKVTLASPAVFTLYEVHPTHWMIFGWYDPAVYGADSGWLVNSIPKARFTAAQAAASLKAILIQHHAGGDSSPPFQRL